MKTENRVAWVTGGNSGIGLATAKLFVENGMKVMITARNEEKGRIAEKELGENAFFVKCDAASSDDIDYAVKKIIDKWGRIDVVVNSAGVSIGDPIQMGGEVIEGNHPYIGNVLDNYKMNVAVNTIAPYEITLKTAKYMARNLPDEWQERGCYIYISSGAATKLSTLSGFSIGYSASKASQIGLMTSVAQNLAPLGIRAVTVLPGLIDTGMVPDFMKEKAPAIDQAFPKRVGEPSQIASMCLEIVKNSFINQTTITVDAGWHITADVVPEQ